jgi:RNA polymerase sigma-70 factor, ECF subfamily
VQTLWFRDTLSQRETGEVRRPCEIVGRGATGVRVSGDHAAEREQRWREYLAGIAGGKSEPLARLYDETAAMLYGLALQILGNPADADEVVVDVFEQIWRTAKTFDPARGSVWRWLTVLTRSRAVDRLRVTKLKQQREQPGALGDETLLSEEPSPHEASILREQQLLIRQALSALPAEQRRCIELAYFSELTHVEIAAALRVPLGTIKTRIRVGMEKLRSALTQTPSALGSVS